MAQTGDEPSRLRYISSDHVQLPLPTDRLDVRDQEDRTIGHFDGIIFDPTARRVQYLVVDRPGPFRHQRYMVPVDPTEIDVEHHALRVGVDSTNLVRSMKFDPRVFPDFSDADLIDTLFSPTADGDKPY